MKRDKALELLRQIGVTNVTIHSEVDWSFYPSFYPTIAVRNETIESSPAAHTKQPFACIGETVKQLQALSDNKYIVVDGKLEYRWSKKFGCFMLRQSSPEMF